GALGQARCVLRQVRQWLDQGIAPEQIVLTARRIDESLAGLYSDVAEEYGVPLQVERRLPLSHCPAVAFLLLALRLPARHWQLRDVTALLRHSYFQPDWPELTSDPSVRYAAELFLRQLGIPQGRRALERAIRYWEQRANAAPPTAPADTDSIPTPITNQPTLTDHHGAPFPYPLDEETEQDNEHSRYLQALAGRCARLLYRLFEQYDTLEQHWVSATDWSDNRLAFLTEQWWEEEGADISPAAESDEPVASIHQPEGKVLLQRLQVFAAGIGLRPGLLSKEEQEALEQLWQGMAEALGQLKVHSWGYLAQVVEQTAQKMERTVSVVQPEGQVLLVEAEEAAGLPCDYLILLDLGEGSWPQSSEAGTLLQEGLRQRLRNAGMPVTTAAERVQHETLLFSHLTKSATRELILSYAAFDAAGEPLLPTALLQDWLENITPGQLTIIRQKMLLDGYWTQQPLSQAEQRIQYAHALVHEGTVDRQRYPAVTDELLRVLQRVEAMTAARWQQPCYTPYDGLIDAPAARQVLQHLFSEGCLFSSTALETYLFCPFRFLAHYVLGLHELPDPTEHIEQSRRGIVLHAALARFHQHLACLGLNPQTLLNTRTEGVAASHHSQNDTVETRADQSTPALNGLDPVVLLEQMIDEAIMAYLPVGQGRLTRELWRWEGVRLRRYAGRYWRQWLRWLTQCQRAGVVPEPAAFETPFGEHDDMCRLTTPAGTVRLGGRIDRVDRATAGEGVWIIDYKTGRGYSYSAAAVQRLERLQLPLYAWAWEQQQGPGQTIPLRGLVYWFVTGDGPKVVWPAGRGKLLRLGDTTGWEQFRHQTMQQIQAVVAAIRQGHFPLLPRDRDCTSHCPYRTICRIRQKPSHKPRCWPPLLQHQPTVTTNKLSTEPIMRESA
ncbi:MAG: PD-(D/E)XK nuclease family protein, partial [Gemmataceae bacterium]|nr:PD-(D/E)XK nuclease family protein [Gemmataceae bacterium]